MRGGKISKIQPNASEDLVGKKILIILQETTTVSKC